MAPSSPGARESAHGVLPELFDVLPPKLRARDTLPRVLVLVRQQRDGAAIKRVVFVDSLSRLVRRARTRVSPWKLTSSRRLGTSRAVLVRPLSPHAIAMCGQCQRVLKLPEHVEEHHGSSGYYDRYESSAVGAGSATYGRPPPGFATSPHTTPPITNVIACVCPSCRAVVQAPLSTPICKCGNCGQLMRVPVAP